MPSPLSVSHGDFYGWLSRPENRRSREDRRLKVEIRSSYWENKEICGSPRAHRELRERRIAWGRHRVAGLKGEEICEPRADGLSG